MILPRAERIPARASHVEEEGEMKRLVRRLRIAALAVSVSAASTCAHAPPATGNHGRDAPLDPDYPEQNCAIYDTVDCRPPAN